MSIATGMIATSIILFTRFITAVRGLWPGVDPSTKAQVYFANHASMGDFILIWTVLPAQLRNITRPVAGSDYWLTSKFKAYIGRKVFNSVLIDRNPDTRKQDPVTLMAEALEQGTSLILFPEGTRNTTDAQLLPFKSGLFHLAKTLPDIELVPVWIDNLNRVLPKGKIVPIPLICTVTFGEPIKVRPRERKQTFLNRAEKALLSLAPIKGDAK